MGIDMHGSHPIVAWIVGLVFLLIGGYGLRDVYGGIRGAQREMRISIALVLEVLAEAMTLHVLGSFILFIVGMLVLMSLAVELFK